MADTLGFNDHQRRLFITANSALATPDSVDEVEVRTLTASLNTALRLSLTSDECESVVRSLMNSLGIQVDRGVAVTTPQHKPWLDERRRDIAWHRWIAYKQFLLNKGWAPTVLDNMDKVSDELLDLLGDPTVQGRWKRRGLAIGDVQSGKTATYIATIDKAIDAGYRLVIILAGSTESLRQQTQERVDEGVIGRSTRHGHQTGTGHTAAAYGIGKIEYNLPVVQTMTTVLKDFTKLVKENTSIQIGKGNEGDTFIVILKKNAKVLEAVYDWLHRQRVAGQPLTAPLLILEDESDYASVNTNPSDDNNPTAINAKIREILGLFTRNSYLAFTATPFANIFIDSDDTDDLFPADYVYALDAPSNYVGASRVFGTAERANHSRTLSPSDAEAYFPARHKKGLRVDALPTSLKEAIETFLIANAVRDLRGHLNDARSMLVNVSRFKDVQSQVSSATAEYVSELRNAVQFHSKSYAKGTPNDSIHRIEETYSKIFSNSLDQDTESWGRVLGVLDKAVERIEVQTFNSDTDKRLDEKNISWDKPRRLIAVGGDVLSRGLTLDGLMVSYFYRRAAAFDTLMQMARWFGYRDGYEDLCRVWIDDIVAGQYRFIDDAVRELKDDLRLMRAQQLTPKEFGLAVKRHPDSLLVTARNKMRSAEVHEKQVSLVGRRVECTRLSSNAETIHANFDAFSGLVEDLLAGNSPAGVDNRTQWRGVDRTKVSEFLTAFSGAASDPLWFENSLAQFVENSPSGKLDKWDVAIVTGSEPHNFDQTGLALGTISVPRRSVSVADNDDLVIGGQSSRLAGPADIARFLSPDEQRSAVNRYRVEHSLSPDANVGEAAFYPALPNPMLLLYPLKVQLKNAADHEFIGATLDQVGASGRLLVAAKLAIPGERAVQTGDNDAVYVINKVAKQLWLPEFTDEEGADGDSGADS